MNAARSISGISTLILLGVFLLEVLILVTLLSHSLSSRNIRCPKSLCSGTRAEDILNVDAKVKATVQRLSGPDTEADDPELVSIIKDHFIDHPRPFMTKFSLPLFKTEQAKRVDQILNGKVGFIFYMHILQVVWKYMMCQILSNIGYHINMYI